MNPRAACFIVLAASAGLLWAGRPSRAALAPAAGQSAALAPAAVGPWNGTPIPVDQRAVQILETDDVALMEYRLEGGSPVWFAKVAGFGNRAAFHPPELCYVGSHFEVLERSPMAVTVNGHPRRVMRLLIGQDGQRYEAWYWFTAGGRMTPSYYQQQWWLMLDTIRRQTASGTLVRISTPLQDGAEASHQRLLAFVNAWDTSHAEADANGS